MSPQILWLTIDEENAVIFLIVLCFDKFTYVYTMTISYVVHKRQRVISKNFCNFYKNVVYYR